MSEIKTKLRSIHDVNGKVKSSKTKAKVVHKECDPNDFIKSMEDLDNYISNVTDTESSDATADAKK